jgi:hypothetical protein
MPDEFHITNTLQQNKPYKCFDHDAVSYVLNLLARPAMHCRFHPGLNLSDLEAEKFERASQPQVDSGFTATGNPPFAPPATYREEWLCGVLMLLF